MRVLIADDQRVVREGLALVLGLLPDVEVAGSASDGDEAVAMAADLLPDIVLMDLRMPRCDGVEATRLLRERVPETKVVVLTTYADDRSVIDALRAGARGYLTKDAGGQRSATPSGKSSITTRSSTPPSSIMWSTPSPPERLSRTGDRAQLFPRVSLPGKPRCCHSSPQACRTDRLPNTSSSAKAPSKATSTTCSPRSAHATAPRRSPSPTSTDLPRHGNSPADSPHRSQAFDARTASSQSGIPVIGPDIGFLAGSAVSRPEG